MGRGKFNRTNKMTEHKNLVGELYIFIFAVFKK